MSFDTDALAVWINGFLLLALVSGALAIVATAMVLRSARTGGRSGGGPVDRATLQLPEITTAHPGARATDRATDRPTDRAA